VRSRAIHLRRRRLAGQAAATLVAVAAVGGSVVFAGSRLTGSDPAGAIQPAGRPTTAVITGTAAPSATAPRPSTSAGPAQTISPSLVAAYRARLGEQDARARDDRPCDGHIHSDVGRGRGWRRGRSQGLHERVPVHGTVQPGNARQWRAVGWSSIGHDDHARRRQPRFGRQARQQRGGFGISFPQSHNRDGDIPCVFHD
jgi:hypothetical protein